MRLIPSLHSFGLLHDCQETGTLEETRACTIIFWIWVAVRTVIWVLIAALTQANAPLDVIEMLFWGREWQWGYHKHPPLPPWLAEAGNLLVPGSPWGIYLISYLLLATCFWAAWRVAREMLSPRAALAAALSLEGLLYYGVLGSELNHNVVLAAVWALTAAFFYLALRTQQPGWWLATGLFAGLGILSKYTIAFLFLPMVLFMLYQREARPVWKKPGPYLAAVVALVIALPHLAWLFQNDFAPIHYAAYRSASNTTLVGHVYFPAYFTFGQIVRVILLFFILLPLLACRWRAIPPEERFNRNFLLAIVLGPFLLHIAMSVSTGREIRDMWGYHLWTFLGLFVLFFWAKSAGPGNYRWFGRCLVLVTAGFLLFALGRNLFGPALTHHASRSHFPGPQLAAAVDAAWQEHTSSPLKIVASGDEWIAGSTSYYSHQQPRVYNPADPHATPWLTDADLQKGGILLWNARKSGDHLPTKWCDRFPQAEVLPPLVFKYQCFGNLAPVRIGMAVIIPPGSKPDCHAVNHQ